jgi:4-amino-4-deoxy-L-arabinose transferase-like glycosyltransferase
MGPLAVGARTAWLSLLAALLTPFLAWQWGAVFIDSFALLAAVILLVLLFRLVETPSPRLWILFFLVGAFAYLCKQMTIFVFIPMTGIALSVGVGKALRHRGVGPMGGMLGGIMLFVILLVPVFYQAYRNVGSEGVYYLDEGVKNCWVGPRLRNLCPAGWTPDGNTP